jgi:hypothetical protein
VVGAQCRVEARRISHHHFGEPDDVEQLRATTTGSPPLTEFGMDAFETQLARIAEMVAPSPSMCSFHRTPGPTLTSRDYRSGRSPDWLKCKNPDAPAVRREAEEDWGR